MVPGAGSTQSIFHSPTWSLEHRAAALWASPVKILPKNTTKASIAGISPFFWPREGWILWAQWRGSSSGTSSCPIPCEMIKTSGREEQFSLWSLVAASVPSAHPFMPLTGFQLLNIGLISSEVRELTSCRAQQTMVKGLYYTWRYL